MSLNMITYELQDGDSIYYVYLIPSADNLHIKYSHQVHVGRFKCQTVVL